MFNLSGLTYDQLEELRKATLQTQATKLEMFAGVMLVATRHAIDAELRRVAKEAEISAQDAAARNGKVQSGALGAAGVKA